MSEIPSKPYNSSNDQSPETEPSGEDLAEQAEQAAALGHLGLKSSVERQWRAERTYSVDVHPASPTENVGDQEIVDRLTLDGVVREAPRLRDQENDITRDNPVTYISRQSHAIKLHTSDEAYAPHRTTMPEFEALQGLNRTLQEAIANDPEGREKYGRYAKSLQENLTFIGEHEYTEATRGIAVYWKSLLDADPNQQLLILAGDIQGSQGYKQTKSDEYLLDRVLEHFSDEELEAYGKRFSINKSELTDDVDNTKVILLDDWTISGGQLSDVAQNFVDTQRMQGRDFTGKVEVQLLAASRERITRGTLHPPLQTDPNGVASMIPVRAYFMAHDSDAHQGSALAESSGTHITGGHSSVDYDFELQIETIINQLNHRDGGGRTMPPLTNVVRPYRKENVRLANIERMNRLHGILTEIIREEPEDSLLEDEDEFAGKW